ncbi:Hypothetical_protein [Hexamita inflata]|uniref:Hypothetical_protein n=1 Tax=Hexamita inflata TaxID=28002 RepID=A0AA86PYU0_9EUKA|nr:Hypothetical protein HINF_LOCUS30264 [Hexamita inflata]
MKEKLTVRFLKIYFQLSIESAGTDAISTISAQLSHLTLKNPDLQRESQYAESQILKMLKNLQTRQWFSDMIITTLYYFHHSTRCPAKTAKPKREPHYPKASSNMLTWRYSTTYATCCSSEEAASKQFSISAETESSSARNKIINWYAIDQNINMRSYESKAYSYKRFADSIVPNNLPLYPFDVQDKIEEYINGKVKSLQNTIKNMSEAVANNFRKELEQDVKQLFGLKGSDFYSYKKQVDKNRYTINQAMKKVRGETAGSYADSRRLDDSCQDSALFVIYDCPEVPAIKTSVQDSASLDTNESFSFDMLSGCFDLFE